MFFNIFYRNSFASNSNISATGCCVQLVDPLQEKDKTLSQILLFVDQATTQCYVIRELLRKNCKNNELWQHVSPKWNVLVYNKKTINFKRYCYFVNKHVLRCKSIYFIIVCINKKEHLVFSISIFIKISVKSWLKTRLFENGKFKREAPFFHFSLEWPWSWWKGSKISVTCADLLKKVQQINNRQKQEVDVGKENTNTQICFDHLLLLLNSNHHFRWNLENAAFL